MFTTRLVVLFSAVVLALPLLFEPAFASQVRLSDKEKQSSVYLRLHTKPNKTYRLNLGEANQKHQVLRTLAKAGKTAQNSPQLFKVLNATIKNHQAQVQKNSAGEQAPTLITTSSNAAPEDLNTIIDFEQTDPATESYSSTAMSSVVGGTNSSTITVNITSPDGQTVYGTNTESQMAMGTEFLVTATATNVPSDVTPITSATFVYVPTTSADDAVTVTTSSELMESAGGNSTMTAPNQCLTWDSDSCTNYATTPINTGTTPLASITYCYQRRVSGTCDYYNPSYTSPASDFLMTTAGTASFITPIASPVSGTWTAQVVSPEGGSCVLQQDAAMDGDPQWTIDSSNASQLNWTIPQITVTSPTACLNYVSGQSLSFLFQGNVDLSGAGTNSQGTFLFTSSDSQTGQGIFIVPELELLASCIAKGTPIMMANGKEKPVEKITTDTFDFVLSEKGVKKEVIATSKGTEMFPMIKVMTNNGHKVLLTRTHPVSTPKGFVMAQDLKVKSVINTINGKSTIKSIKTVDYSGTVHNLSLGSIDEAKQGTSTFYAGGILVGDLSTQTHYENVERQKLKKDPNHVCQRLPPEWQTDGGCQ